MINRILKGNSGCLVELVETDKANHFVRKTSSSETYNHRLEQQVAKQIEFGKRGFKVPKIWNTGFSEKNCIYYEMEYVSGLKVSEYLNSSMPRSISNELLNLLEEMRISQGLNVNNSFVREQLQGHLSSKPSDHRLNAAVHFLEEFDWEAIESKECHGDLTLENLIVNEKGIYLLDFQDVTINCFSQDIGKLLFDLEWNWSARYTTSEKNSLVNYGNRFTLIRDIHTKFYKEFGNEFPNEISAFELFNAIRILPYIKDRESDKVVSEAMTTLMDRLKIT